MSTKKRVGILISVVILGVIVLVGYLTIAYTYQEYKLKEEVIKLSLLNISKDKFNDKYVTIGDYRKVEMSIKNYLQEYADSLQEINSLVNDNKITKIISYDNLNNDNYDESSIYIKNSLDLINKDLDKLIYMSSEESIRNYILQYDLDKYYVDLYNELMLGNNISNKLNISTKYLEDYKSNINNKLNTCTDIFKFLDDNKDNYSFEDGKIKFNNNDLVNQYNNYIDKIST